MARRAHCSRALCSCVDKANEALEVQRLGPLASSKLQSLTACLSSTVLMRSPSL